MNTSVTVTTFAKNLTQEAPRSPRQRLGGYSILSRLIDKCRAEIEGHSGEYHFNCPLDQKFFEFKGINAEDMHRSIAEGLSDQEILQWVNLHGKPKSRKEIQQWSQEMEQVTFINQLDKRDFFIEECEKVGLDPMKATLFEWLETDDQKTFKK